MSKFTDSFRKYRTRYIVAGVIGFLIGVGIFCLCFFLGGIHLISAINACTYSAIALVFSGALLWVAEQGIFDTFAYGFKQMFASAFNRKANVYNDMASYKQDKAVKRENSARIYVSLFFASILFVIAIIVLEIIYNLHL